MEKMTFWGYRRPDGRVGIRNKILILPASVCASDTTRIIASQVESAVTFPGSVRSAVHDGCNGRICSKPERIWNGCCITWM